MRHELTWTDTNLEMGNAVSLSLFADRLAAMLLLKLHRGQYPKVEIFSGHRVRLREAGAQPNTFAT